MRILRLAKSPAAPGCSLHAPAGAAVLKNKGVVVLWGFYREQEEFVPGPGEFPGFGFLENVSVGEVYNLYDFLHGCCDQFAAALSDFFGYEIEYVVGNDGNLIHAYCVREMLNGKTAFIDARGITTDAELFFDEFADWCDYDADSGILYDLDGECQVFCHKDTKEMYSDENRELNQDEDLYQFLKDNGSYYDVKVFEKEKKNMDNMDKSMMDMDWEKEAEVLQKAALDVISGRGMDISQMRLFVLQCMGEERQNCLWYGGQVAELEYKGFTFSLEAKGYVNCVLFDENNRDLLRVKDDSENGVLGGELWQFLENDDAIRQAKNDGRLVLENNNWFEIFVMTPDEEWLAESKVCSGDSLSECIVEMAENMDLMIENYAQGLTPVGNSKDTLLKLALEAYEYVAAACVEDAFFQRHAEAFIYGYQNGVSQIDMDFWVQYEELLGEKMSYEEYLFVDGLYEGDPLELIDVELSDDEKIGFAGLKEALVHLRNDKFDENGKVGALVAHYLDRWTPDNYDTIRDEIAATHGDVIAAAANAILEKEYRSWFGVDATLDDAKSRSASGVQFESKEKDFSKD